MKNKHFLDELTAHLCEALPTHLKEMKGDIEKNFHVILQSAFNQLNLVSREEFDAQTKVLARSRKKLDALENRINELEKQLAEK